MTPLRASNLVQRLLTHIESITHSRFEDNNLDKFLKNHKLGKGDRIRDGFSENFYFVSEGCIRLVFLDKVDNERTLQFGLENWWVFDSSVPGLELEALEESVLLSISKTDFEALLSTHPVLEAYFRKVFQRTAQAWQKKSYYDATMNPQEIYEQFAKNNPEFIQRIPQKYFASYLGFTPEALSRARNKRSDRN